jgi:hypothetical protein
MKIIKYSCRGSEGWRFPEVEFGSLNLLVGNSASGKTKFLNTIFNIGRMAVSNQWRAGEWEITFAHQNEVYHWEIHSDSITNDGGSGIISEELHRITDVKERLIYRDGSKFQYLDQSLPKLSRNESAIHLLKEEERIAKPYQAFERILRRRFSHDALTNVVTLSSVASSPGAEKADGDRPSSEIADPLNPNNPLSARLYYLSSNKQALYGEIMEQFKQVFPFIREDGVLDISKTGVRITGKILGHVPVFCIKEADGDWVPITELSSGMQKVLLVITDIITMPEGGVYIIDEYENSLGINAIDFLPDFINSHNKEIQYFITSHHPYLINEVSPEHWYVFHREGLDVSIKYGTELQERYGKSKQKAFTQLINDRFYNEGAK